MWRPLKKFKKEKRQKYFVREDYWEFAAASTAGGEKLVLRVSFARVTTAMSLIYSCIKSRPDQKPQRRRITRVWNQQQQLRSVAAAACLFGIIHREQFDAESSGFSPHLSWHQNIRKKNTLTTLTPLSVWIFAIRFRAAPVGGKPSKNFIMQIELFGGRVS